MKFPTKPMQLGFLLPAQRPEIAGPQPSAAIFIWRVVSNPEYWHHWLLKDSHKLASNQTLIGRGTICQIYNESGKGVGELEILHWHNQQKLVLIIRSPGFRIAHSITLRVASTSNQAAIELCAEYELIGWRRYLSPIYRILINRRQIGIAANLDALLSQG